MVRFGIITILILGLTSCVTSEKKLQEAYIRKTLAIVQENLPKKLHPSCAYLIKVPDIKDGDTWKWKMAEFLNNAEIQHKMPPVCQKWYSDLIKGLTKKIEEGVD